MKVSFSKFAELQPKECVLAGSVKVILVCQKIWSARTKIFMEYRSGSGEKSLCIVRIHFATWLDQGYVFEETETFVLNTLSVSVP